MIIFVASEKHYLEHLIPTFLALPEEYQGKFYINGVELCNLGESKGIPGNKIVFFDLARVDPLDPRNSEIRRPLVLPKGPGYIFTSAIIDAQRVHEQEPLKKIILCEHGCGQIYDHGSPSYAGGLDRGWLTLCIVPGERPWEKQKRVYPDVPCIKTGCPKLDTFADYVKPDKILQFNNMVVGVSTHYTNAPISEMDSAFLYFWNQIESLVKAHPKTHFIGHTHPRVKGGLPWEKWNELKALCPNVRTTHDFDEIMQEADLYIIDQSSTAYEFAALDKPVLFLNSPHFRKHINHGMRFWEFANIGVQCNYEDSLEEKMVEALMGEYNNTYTERRREVTALIYSIPLGQAAQFTAQALVDFVNDKPIQEGVVTEMSTDNTQIIKMRALKMFVKDEGTLFPGIVFAPGYEVTLEKGENGEPVGVIGERIRYINSTNVRCSQMKFDGLADYVFDQDEPDYVAPGDPLEGDSSAWSVAPEGSKLTAQQEPLQSATEGAKRQSEPVAKDSSDAVAAEPAPEHSEEASVSEQEHVIDLDQHDEHAVDAMVNEGGNDGG